MEGHAATHVPEERKDVAVAMQLRHCVALGPLHVPHVEWHGSQTDDAFAYLPAGVQDERHEP